VSEPFAVAHLSELEADLGTGRRWATIRVDFGISSFGVNAYSVDEPGADVIGEHDETGPNGAEHEELYFVARGSATFTVNGEELDAPTGTFVFVRDPAAKRKAVAKEPGTTVVVVGAKPGEAFEPSSFEHSAPALKYWNRDWPKAVELMREAYERHPDEAPVAYNLACAEAQNGDREQALEHLSRALELQPDMRDQAREDPDFASIRDEAAFPSA
jgi:tetratricopeptide (TPR) repeat protein